MRLIGRGHSAAQRLLSALNLPSAVGRGPWSSHTKVLEKAANDLLEQELENAALEVKRWKLANDEILVDGNHATDERLRELLVDAGVSIDGSWSSRGWSARDGVVAVVSIDTGKVLDVVYLSNSCTACQQKERERGLQFKNAPQRRQFTETRHLWLP